MSEMSVNKRSVSQEIDKKGICLFAIITIVLVYGTGIVSDDITEIAARREMHDFWGSFIPRKNFANAPISNLTHNWVFSFIDIDNLLLVDIIKMGHAILSLYMVAKFFSAPLPTKSRTSDRPSPPRGIRAARNPASVSAATNSEA